MSLQYLRVSVSVVSDRQSGVNLYFSQQRPSWYEVNWVQCLAVEAAAQVRFMSLDGERSPVFAGINGVVYRAAAWIIVQFIIWYEPWDGIQRQSGRLKGKSWCIMMSVWAVSPSCCWKIVANWLCAIKQWRKPIRLQLASTTSEPQIWVLPCRLSFRSHPSHCSLVVFIRHWEGFEPVIMSRFTGAHQTYW